MGEGRTRKELEGYKPVERRDPLAKYGGRGASLEHSGSGGCLNRKMREKRTMNPARVGKRVEGEGKEGDGQRRLNGGRRSASCGGSSRDQAPEEDRSSVAGDPNVPPSLPPADRGLVRGGEIIRKADEDENLVNQLRALRSKAQSLILAAFLRELLIPSNTQSVDKQSLIKELLREFLSESEKGFVPSSIFQSFSKYYVLDGFEALVLRWCSPLKSGDFGSGDSVILACWDGNSRHPPITNGLGNI